MKKKSLLFFVLGIFLINFVSAFNGFNLGGYFDSSLIAWAALFLIFFIIINFTLKRTVFKKDTATKFGLTFSISVLIIYYLVKSGFDLESFSLGNLEIGRIIYPILPVLLVIGLIYLIYYLRRFTFLVLGILFILLSTSEFVYATTLLLILGIIFIIIWAILRLKRIWPPKWKTEEPRESRYKEPRERKKWWNREPRERREPNPEQPQRQEEEQKIIYERRRTLYDLRQKYGDYKFKIFNRGMKAQERKRILQAMYIIEKQLKKLGGSVPGKSPKQIEKRIRNNPKMWPIS